MSTAARLDTLIAAAERGDAGAMESLFRAIYDDLRSMAGGLMRHEPAGLTLQPTALVNEAWARIVSGDAALPLESRRRLFGTFGRAMVEILIDRSRRAAVKRRRPLPSESAVWSEDSVSSDVDDLAQVAAVFEDLVAHDPGAAEVVQLKVFCGRTMNEVAQLTQRPKRAVERDWTYSKQWLAREIERRSTL